VGVGVFVGIGVGVDVVTGTVFNVSIVTPVERLTKAHTGLVVIIKNRINKTTFFITRIIEDYFEKIKFLYRLRTF
jgi:hypothetical protein